MDEVTRFTDCGDVRRTMSLRLAAGARGLPSIEAGDIEAARAHLAVCDGCRSVVDRLVAAVREGHGDELSCAEAGSRLATAIRRGADGIDDRAWPFLAVHLAMCPECRGERDVLVDVLGELSRGTLPAVPPERVTRFDLSFVDEPTTPPTDRSSTADRRSALARWMLGARSWIGSLANRSRVAEDRTTGSQRPSAGGPPRHRRAAEGPPAEATRPGRRHWTELAIVAGMALVVIAVMRSVTAPAPQPPAADPATITASTPQRSTPAPAVTAPTSTEVPGIAPAGRPTRPLDADGDRGAQTPPTSPPATPPAGRQERPARENDRGERDDAPARPSMTPNAGSAQSTTPTDDTEPYPGPTEVPPATWVPYPGPTDGGDPGAETGTPPAPSSTPGSAEPTATVGGQPSRR